MATKRVKFQAHLQRCGASLEEMKRLLLAYEKWGNFKLVKKKAQEENLLGKSSGKTIEGIIRAFRRRFLSKSWLPPTRLVAQVLQSSIPEAAKIQIMFPYFIVTDALVERCYCDLVLPRIHDSNPTLTSEDVLNHLEVLSKEHPELLKWSLYLKKKWARSFIALLRRFDLMEQHPKSDLKRMWLLPESFAFFLIWFWQKKGSFWMAIDHSIWDLMQTNSRGKEDLLIEGQLRGWWSYQRSGFVVDFQPNFNNLEELIRSWAGMR